MRALRAIARLSGLDRKTVRRYVEAAKGLGLAREAGEDQLDEVLIDSVVEAVRPHRGDAEGRRRTPWWPTTTRSRLGWTPGSLLSSPTTSSPAGAWDAEGRPSRG